MRMNDPAHVPFRILVVCLGNICRSPTAEAALREALAEAGLQGCVQVDSAGTGDWHLGHPPDPRMVAAAAARGLTVEGRARRVRADELGSFDLVLAADRGNLRDLRALADGCVDEDRMRLLRVYDPAAGDEIDVPDPYGGDAGLFDDVVAICRRAAAGVVADLDGPGRARVVRAEGVA